jgi:hypothetical protein
MLKLVSRFVLEVLPYVLTALIAAAIVVPGFVLSQLHGSQSSGGLRGADHADSAFELMPDNYAGDAREQVLSSNLLHNQLFAK